VKHQLDIEWLHQRLKLLVNEQRLGARVLQDVADLVAVEPRVDRHDHQPGRRHAVMDVEHGRNVRQDGRHPVEMPQPQRA
jgi:hypothetical protein